MPDATNELSDLLAFLHLLADAAGEAILPGFRSTGEFENKAAKSAFDPVTAADRAGEQTIRRLVLERYPDHSIRGEEFPPHEGSSAYTWVLDPIDGTKAFIIGVPVWSTLIGLLKDGEPFIGIMNQPFVGERFIGSPLGAYSDGPQGPRTLKTSSTTNLADALIGTTFPGRERSAPSYQKYFELEAATKGFRFGGDAYFYCLLAAGHMDIVVDADMGDYDIVALIPIIEAAGGIVTGWGGGSAAGGGNIVAAATPELHSAALEILAG